MDASLRQHWLPTVAYAFFFLNGVFTFADDTHIVLHILRIVLGIVGLGALIWTFRYKNVFEFKDDHLLLYRLFSRPLKIHRDTIDCIALEQHFLRSSKIMLKNGKVYTFSDGPLSFDELRSFMRHAGIPVKG